MEKRKQELKNLLAAELELENDLVALRYRIREIRASIMLEEKGVKIGDKIQLRSHTGEIVSCNGWHLFYKKHLKDGKLGKLEIRLWSSDSFTVINNQL